MIELLEFIDGLGSRNEFNCFHKILVEGSSADRQSKVYHESGGDLKVVVDLLIKETLEDVM